MKQAEDFAAECRQIETLLRTFTSHDFERETGFKDWTINRIIHHLHTFNHAAFLSLEDETGFDGFREMLSAKTHDMNMGQIEADYCDNLHGLGLLELWADFYPQLADAFAKVDPKTRLEWFGPSMSARSSITARLMESWSHAQAIYDEKGVIRSSGDGIENIAILDLNTYGWTFINRGIDVPQPRPQLTLIAPSGAEWVMGEDTGSERITGSAEEFCQVVTQTRNIADTDLVLSGANAAQWMGFAQCFAGPPNDPPAAGIRTVRKT